MSDETRNASPGGEPYKGLAPHLQYSIEDLFSTLINTAIKVPDKAEGRTLLTDLVMSAFNGRWAKEWTVARILNVQLEEDVASVKAERDETAEALATTPEWLPASQVNHGRDGDDMVETPFSDWTMPDRTEASLLFAFLLLAMAASGVTAHSNLTGTGLPVFLDNPILPISMAALAPLIGVAIKTLYSHLHSAGLKTAFIWVLGIAMVISGALWILLFAHEYHGLSAGAGLGGLFDEPTLLDKISETGLTVVTLVTEVLITSCIAVRLSAIAATYSPGFWVKNPEFVTLTNRLATLKKTYAELVLAQAEAEGSEASFQASLDTQKTLALIVYDARRGVQSDPML